MHGTATDAYLESRVVAADPVELVRILYQLTAGAVRDARRNLAAGDIAARARSISKAWEALAELTASLDRERGGEIADGLGRLYRYMQRRLLEANVQQSDEPLAEVLELIATLAEGWEKVGRRPEREVAAGTAWNQPAPRESSDYASQAWSF